MSTAQQGWICPRCDRGVSPLVSVCPCRSEGSAGVTAVPVPPPITPPVPGTTLPDSVTSLSVWPHTIGITPSWAQTATAGTVPVGTLSATWEGVTILNAGKAAA
jgi:hypothetical protein